MSIALTYNGEAFRDDELVALVNGCVQNNRRAQEKLYSLFYPRMRSMVYRYFPEYEMCEEILNTGFLKAFKRISTYAYKGSFEGWLRRIIFNTITDYANDHIKYKKQFLFIEKEVVIEKNAADKLYMDDLLKLVESLPDDCRTIFNMAVIEGLPHKEIGKLLGIPVGTSKWYLSKARNILKSKIEASGIYHQTRFEND